MRDLQLICKKHNIPELIIIKCEKYLPIINKLRDASKEIKKVGLKINVVKGRQNITNKELQQLIINDFHMLPTGGHAGINRMYNNIKRYYCWIGMRKNLEDFVKRCEISINNQ